MTDRCECGAVGADDECQIPCGAAPDPSTTTKEHSMYLSEFLDAVAESNAINIEITRAQFEDLFVDRKLTVESDDQQINITLKED